MRLNEILTSSQIERLAQQYENQFEKGHIARRPASQFDWHYDPDYSMARIAYKNATLGIFKRDQKAWADEGEPDRYDDMLKEPVREPIIVVEIRGRSYIWDGNHRVGASLVANRSTVPAYVGTLKKKLREFIEPLACYYHGSIIPDLKTLKARPSKLVDEAVVFAAILPEIAVAMSGQWSDEDFSFGHDVATHRETRFRPYVMRERRPGMFEKFFRQPLTLYAVPATYFEAHEALQDFEVLSYTDVPVHAIIAVDDALAYLQASPVLRLR